MTFDPSIALVPPRLLATSEEIYGRASNSFPTAVFFKPAGGSDADLTFRLAPLILQEVQDNDPTSRLQPDSIGSLAPMAMRTLPIRNPRSTLKRTR